MANVFTNRFSVKWMRWADDDTLAMFVSPTAETAYGASVVLV